MVHEAEETSVRQTSFSINTHESENAGALLILHQADSKG